MKFGIDVDPSFLEAIGAILGRETSRINQKIQKGLSRIAYEMGEFAKDKAQKKLKTQAGIYESAVRVEQTDEGNWVVSLDPSASNLEQGWASFDMKPGLLKTSRGFIDIPQTNDEKDTRKNALGKQRRSGVRMSKEGYRYRPVPFSHTLSAASAKSRLNSRPVEIQNPITDDESTRAPGEEVQSRTTYGDMMKDMNRLLRGGRLSGVTLDRQGMPIVGKVGSITQLSNGLMRARGFNGADIGQKPGSNFRDFKPGKGGYDPNVIGVTKYQYQDEQGGIKTSYMTFRMVSEKVKDKWIHPGFDGVRAFDDINNLVEQKLQRLLSDAVK
jgi:hypothetical protein